MDPIRPIDVRVPREVDAVTAPVLLTKVEREEARERREEARKRRRKAPSDVPDRDRHVDLRA